MKRLLILTVILCIMLCGCATADHHSSVATPDAVPTEQASAAPASPTEPTAKPTDAPTTGQLVEKRVAEILSGELTHDSASIPIEPMDQYPELPTGCESVALTVALNALGCDLSKTEIAENYLEYNDNYVLGYCGDPFEDDGAGVMPIGIVTTVENYAQSTGAPVYAVNTSKLPLSELYKFIEAGCPALVWTTYYLDEPMETDDSIEYDGEIYNWYDNEHCVTLFGYDRSAGTVDIADPLQGAVTVDADEFARINELIGGWSVAVLDTSKLKEK